VNGSGRGWCVVEDEGVVVGIGGIKVFLIESINDGIRVTKEFDGGKEVMFIRW
jgi:hypothetical protein